MALQLRRDTAANWTANNSLLESGQPGYEIDTGKIKIGDGVTHWNSLNYIVTGAGTGTWGAINGTIGSQTDLQTELATKQATLVSGTNIKTVNSLSLLGSGNLAIQGTPQTLSANPSDLSTLIATANANPTLQYSAYLTANTAIATSEVVPSNVFIEPVNGAMFTKSGSGTIEFQGPGIIGDPLVQIFSGFAAGDVSWTKATPTFRPEWFGAVGDGVTDDLAAFQALRLVADYLHAIKIVLTQGKTFYLSDTWDMDIQFTLEGESSNDGGNAVPNMQWAANKKGIVIHHVSTRTGAVEGTDRSASYSAVRNVYLASTPGFVPTHTVNVSGLTITKTAGEDFTVLGGYIDGVMISVDGFAYVIDTIPSTSQVTILKPRIYFSVPYGSTAVTRQDYTVWPTGGEWVGQNIEIAGTNYLTTAVTGGGATLSSPYLGPIDQSVGAVSMSGAASANALTATAHGLVTGQAVEFLSTSGSIPTGLVFNKYYYVIVVDADHVKFATSYANALANTPISISGGSGNHVTLIGATLTTGYLQSLGTLTGVSAQAHRFHGIHLKGPANIVGNRVFFFSGSGIALEAQSGPTAFPGTVPNDNNARVDRNIVSYNRGHGIFSRGLNSNQELITNNDVTANWGAGIWEAGFLGNNYIGNHASFNSFAATYATAFGGSVFIAEYSEGGSPSSLYGPNMITFGGVNGAGFDPASNQADIRNIGTRLQISTGYFNSNIKSASTKGVGLVLGSQQPNTILGFGAAEGAGNITQGLGPTNPVGWFEYQLGYDQLEAGWYSLYYGGNYGTDQANSVLAMSGSNATEGGSKLWLYNGFYAGATSVRRNWQFVDTIPTSGTVGLGDIFWNSDVDLPADPTGWIVTTAGTIGSGAVLTPFSFTTAPGITMGTTPSDGGSDVILKTSSTGKVNNATGLTNSSTKQLTVTAQSATDIPATIQLAAAQSGNALNITSNGGSDGDILNLSPNNGGVRINVGGSGAAGNYIGFASGFMAFGDVRGTGDAVAYFNAGKTFQVVDNVGALPNVCVDTANTRIKSGQQFGFSSSSTDASTAADAGVKRSVAKVVAATDGSSGTGWFKDAGCKQTAVATNATNTMSNGVLTDLTVTLISGQKYSGIYVFYAKNSTAVEGLQFDFNGGAAGFSSVEFGFVSTPPGSGLVLGTLTSTAIGTAITATTATTADAIYMIAFSGVCNGAGTLIPRFAENSAHTSGTATIEALSYCDLRDAT